jgi:hypothetical protein
MANNLNSNTSEIVLRKFLPGFMSDTVSCKTVNRQIIGDGDLNPSTGDSISVKRPHQAQVFRTADGDMTGNNSPVISGKASAEVQDYISVPVESTDIEQALESDQWEEVLRPVRTRMITELETSLNAFMLNNSSHLLGTAGTALTKWGEVGEVNAFLQSMGCPNDGMRFAQINPYGQVGLADAQNGLASGSNDLVDTAWKRAQITRNFGGMQAYTSNALTNHTAGNQVSNAGITVASPPIQTYVSTKDTYTMDVALTGLTATTGTIAVGESLQFTAASGSLAWLNQETKQAFTDASGGFVKFTATVLAGGTADGSGNLTVTVTGPSIFDATAPAYNSVTQAIAAGDGVAVISAAANLGVTQPNLFYHRDAFGLCSVKLKKLKGWDSSVVNNEGFSIRLTQFSDAVKNTHGWRFDMLPAFTAFNPYMAGRFFGKP